MCFVKNSALAGGASGRGFPGGFISSLARFMKKLLFANSSYLVQGMKLGSFSRQTAQETALAIAAMEPWISLGFEVSKLAGFLFARQPCTYRFHITRHGRNIGALSIRHPWLYGPYIELLAILPDAQKKGFGKAVIDWIESEIKQEYGNIWVAASSFNEAAISFYQKNGFCLVGSMPGLVRPGFEEKLFRKQLFRSGV